VLSRTNAAKIYEPSIHLPAKNMSDFVGVPSQWPPEPTGSGEVWRIGDAIESPLDLAMQGKPLCFGDRPGFGNFSIALI